ncbi:stealth conserved region 3 domain-containing protein [Glutamicibacter sp. JC586]|uniref:stealth conserved region 3 domain-containing protein n=1 Tax=Glutamicibacter sp. JC586 TaxID=2590552 RepID=UPI00135C9D1D|nr:stealth conserved region 3 domain-containing protein [Glutamicibacter sp. JC586]
MIANNVKRLRNKIRREVHSRIDEVGRARGKKKSLRELRESNVRSDLMLLPSAGEQMLFRLTRSMNLSEIREESRLCISRILDEAGMIHWGFPSKSNAASNIHTLAGNGYQLFAALRGSHELSHWYFQFVRPDGKSVGGPRLVRELKWSKHFHTIRLFERVAYNTTSSFRSGASQGVLLSFWEESQLPVNVPTDALTSEAEEEEVVQEVIIAPLWNECCTLLPNPIHRESDFVRSLSEAENPLATHVDFEIDAVYTWVDGADELWQTQKASALNVLDEQQFVDDAVSDARFADHDELRYSLRSIDQFAPWIRKIWIVTAGQVPKWLDTSNPRVEIISHEDIWPDSTGLPNFNSHAIESNLHRINGLADHYLYFNDDFFLTRPLDPSAFFFGNGISKVFFSKAMVEFTEVSGADNASSVAAKNARHLLLSRGYSSFSRKFFHTPSPLDKNVVKTAEIEFEDAFRETRAAQFRDSNDIAVSGSFYFNYALASGHAVPGQIKYDYIDPATTDGRDRMKRVIKRRDKDCIVINDGSTPESTQERAKTDAFIRDSLELLLPVKSKFEI